MFQKTIKQPHVIVFSLFSIISIVGILWCHERNPWIVSFDRQSLAYIAYFIFRILALGILLSSCISMGSIFLGMIDLRFKEQAATDNIICDFFVGSALLNLLYSMLGLSYALSFWATLGLYVICALFLYRKITRCTFEFAIYKNIFRPISLNKLIATILAILFCVGITDLFIRSTLLPVLISDGDTFTNYLPYFNQVINETFGFSIDNNFLMYHVAKGSGLQAYMMLLSDISFGTTISFVFVCGMLAVLFRILYRQGVPSSLLFLAGFLLVTSRMVKVINFYKNHLALAGMLVGFLFLLDYLRKEELPAKAALALYGIGALLYYPPFAVFYVFVLFCYMMLDLWHGNKERALQYMRMGILIIAGMLCVLGYEYLAHGIADYQLKFFWDIADIQKLSSLLGQTGLQLYYCLHKIATPLPVSNDVLEFIGKILFADVYAALGFSSWRVAIFLSLFAGMLFFAFRRRQPEIFWILVLMELLLGIAVYGVRHQSFDRVICFKSFIFIYIFITALHATIARAPGNKALVTGLACVAILGSSWPTLTNDLRVTDWKFYSKFLFNEAPYSYYYDYNQNASKFYTLQKEYLKDTFCIDVRHSSLLASLPNSHFITGEQFNNPAIEAFVKYKGEELYTALLQNNVHYVVVCFDRPTSYLGYSNFFNPSFLSHYTKLVSAKEGLYLFELTKQSDSQVIPFSQNDVIKNIAQAATEFHTCWTESQ